LNFAKGYFRLNQPQKSAEYLQKSLAYIEEIRKSENYNLSLGLSENYHDAYRLLMQIKFENPQESFELADFVKARLLKDRIDNAAIKYKSVISPMVRKTLEELSLKYIDDQSIAPEIEGQEKLVTNVVPELNIPKPDLIELDKIPDLDNSAVVSYFFTLDKKLTAFVREKGKPIQITNLPVSETEADALAKTTQQKIKNFIFFKRDGKEIYDKLLKPLNLAANHLIIVPDKSLWKIPFQALSADGEKYLIEDKLISYAPSVSVLLEQVKNPKPTRQTLQAFANPSYNNQFLQYVNTEAARVAAVYKSKPVQNATVADFKRNAENVDILHFSMHAQVDSELPLESFLAFRKDGTANDGRLTVDDLLKIKLKNGSLAFLASCDTNNVMSGEGLVSIAWAMMGSGATTVVSAQWEANDKSTEIFTKTFYVYYKQGSSSAEALQKASLELIKNKSNKMHEPYYWADFTLNGDYR
jgi:CHAT domain-containing protein